MRARPIKCGMEYKHRCGFCGWSRPSATSVMLAPSCEQCGCALDAVPAGTTARSSTRPFSLSPRSARVLAAVAALFAALTLYAAAKLGYNAAGASGAIIALGLAGFLLLPCLPERIR